MPTVLGGKGKLSIVCFLLRCAYSQVTRSQHNGCAKDIFEDMTQSWPSQQALGGDLRTFYNSKDPKQSSAQQRQNRGDAPLRMPRHPYVAPHKSMLADDLKLSSDDDDTQRAINESTSWERHSLSAKRAHTHGRRVRHSSSDSSDSDSSAESRSSSVPSRSPSPEVHPDPPSPANPLPPCNNKETDHPSPTQWQLDKWLKRSKKKSGSTERNHSRKVPERQRSPQIQRAPSPARSWDSHQEYSPSQSPIPSPKFNHSHNNSPIPSPGYSYCPSPSPFPSTCPSPNPSPRHSSVPSPALSLCPSPCGSPRASRSPSPLPKDPPRSPSPTLRAPPRVCHYLDGQSQTQGHPSLTSDPHRTRIRPWFAPVPTIKTRTTTTSSHQPSYQHRPKTHPSQNQVKNPSRLKAPVVSTSNQTHNHNPTPRPASYSNAKQPSDAHKAKNTPHVDPIQINQSNHKPRPPFQQSNPTRAKHPVSSSREARAAHGSLSQPTYKATNTSGVGSSSRSSPSQVHRSKSWEPTISNPVHVNNSKTAVRKLPAKAQEVNQRRSSLNQSEDRKHERKEDRHNREKQRGKPERKEDRRLAEEQLLRRPWIQSSAEEEEEEEEEAVIEQQVGRDEAAKEESRRKEEQLNKWLTALAKDRGPSNFETHRLRESSDHQERTTKRGRCEEDRGPSPHLSSHSPNPHRPSSSSSSSSSTTSSNSDSESEYLISTPKVSADSISHKTFSKKGHQVPSRPDAPRPQAVHSRGPNSGPPCEGQQSERKQKLYTLVPFGRSEKAPPTSQRGLRNLVVHIDLCLLKRVPDSTTNSPANKNTTSSSSSLTKDRPREVMKHVHVPEASTKDGKRKRKLENGVSDRECKRSLVYADDPSGPTESSVTAETLVTETTHNGYLEEYLDKRPMSPLSPLSPLPQSPEPTKPTSKTKTTEQQNSRTQKSKEKNRDQAVKPKMEVECVKVSKQPQPSSESSWRPADHRGAVPNHETPHHAEYYLHEAKRMKHRADAMVDKLGKAVNYVDAALSFMECGKAMEEGPLEAKSPYTMYSETVELIRYAMKLKSHSGPGARQEDKQLAVLCFRCLALLYWQMFRLKKDHALKYSKVLLDYFKSSPKVPTTPPGWNDCGKSMGEHPSSLSPNAKHRRRDPHGGSSSSLISIPQRIHQMAANHLNITNSVLYSYEYWEVADNLAKENKEFFNYLNTLSGPLTLHSSIAHAVQYTRQALQWIRISAKLN